MLDWRESDPEQLGMHREVWHADDTQWQRFRKVSLCGQHRFRAKETQKKGQQWWCRFRGARSQGLMSWHSSEPLWCVCRLAAWGFPPPPSHILATDDPLAVRATCFSPLPPLGKSSRWRQANDAIASSPMPHDGEASSAQIRQSSRSPPKSKKVSCPLAWPNLAISSFFLFFFSWFIFLSFLSASMGWDGMDELAMPPSPQMRDSRPAQSLTPSNTTGCWALGGRLQREMHTLHCALPLIRRYRLVPVSGAPGGARLRATGLTTRASL